MSCVASFFLDVCSFTSVTIFSLSRWLWLLLILLGIRSLESEMCLHFEYVTNYLLRLTLRDLAEAFTLLRCCLGQTFFYRVALSFWLSLSDKGFPSQMWTQEKVKTHYADVCLWACTHVLIWVYAWTCGVGTLPTCPQYFSQLGRIHLFIIQQKTRGNYLNNLTTLMYF